MQRLDFFRFARYLAGARERLCERRRAVVRRRRDVFMQCTSDSRLDGLKLPLVRGLLLLNSFVLLFLFAVPHN